MFEVGDRLSPLLLLAEEPAAVDQCFGIVRLLGEPAVHLGQFGGAPRLGLNDFADDPYRPRRRHRASGVARSRGSRVRWRVPVQPHRGELVADPPQVPDQRGLLVSPGDQLRAVGAEDQRCRADRLQGRQPGKLPAGRGIGQQHLIGAIPRAISRPSAGERRRVRPRSAYALRIDPKTRLPRPHVPELVKTGLRIGCRARNEPAAVGAEADRRTSSADGILRSQDALEPAPVQVPDPDTRLIPAADRQPAAVRADGDRVMRLIPPAVESRGPAPCRVGMARIDEQDSRIAIVGSAPGSDDRAARLARFHSSAASRSNSGGPTRIASGPTIGIGPDRPAIEAPFAGADEVSSVGVKQHGLAATGLEMGQFAARVGLPESDAIPVAGRHQPAVGADVGRHHPDRVPRLVAVAEHAGVERPTLWGHGYVPHAELPIHTEGQPAVIRREPALQATGAIARSSPERRVPQPSCRPSSWSPAGNPNARIGRATIAWMCP